MPSRFDRRTLSVRSRLIIVAGLCTALAALPTTLLAIHFVSDYSVAQREATSLVSQRAWQSVVSALSTHLVQAAAARVKPEIEATRQKSAAGVDAAIETLRRTLVSEGAAPRHIAAADALRTQFDQLAAAVASKQLAPEQLLQRERAIEEDAFASIESLAADGGLALDTQPSAHYMIHAGLQAAPRVSSALSELSAIAAAITIDDIALVSSASTRYHQQVEALRVDLTEAGVGSPRLAAQFAPVLEQLKVQRTMVDDALAAAASDVNYPLATMSRTLDAATHLQMQVVGADSKLSHRADPNLSQGWTPSAGRSSVDKCRSSAVC